MTGTALRELVRSSEFRQGLEELSSYLASIMQERPIVYLVARCLWRRGYKFELEYQRYDLFLDGKRIEFKFNFDRCQEGLARVLETYGADLRRIGPAVKAGKLSKSWGAAAKVYEDICIRRPNIFVWVVCSRDLSQVAPDDLERIAVWRDQCKYNRIRPYGANGGRLPEIDMFLRKLQGIRPFRLLKEAVRTAGDFPSTYHFRICDFAPSPG
jgi:hypothetical protein